MRRNRNYRRAITAYVTPAQRKCSPEGFHKVSQTAHVRQRTGHRSVAALRMYKRPSKEQLRSVSKAISDTCQRRRNTDSRVPKRLSKGSEIALIQASIKSFSGVENCPGNIFNLDTAVVCLSCTAFLNALQ